MARRHTVGNAQARASAGAIRERPRLMAWEDPRHEGWPERVRVLVADRRLRAEEATAEQIAALWQKAVESAGDATLPRMSVDGALRAAYDAGHLAALALLLVYGLRTGSGPGHHELAFAVAEMLAPGLLQDLLPESSQVRSLRRGSAYDPVIAGAAERDKVLAWMRRTLPSVRAAMIQRDPSLGDMLIHIPNE